MGRRTDESVVGAIRAWLEGLELEGVDTVRAQLALRLGNELDDPDAPRYARPRVVSELRAVLAEIEGKPTTDRDGLRRLLAEVRR